MWVCYLFVWFSYLFVWFCYLFVWFCYPLCDFVICLCDFVICLCDFVICLCDFVICLCDFVICLSKTWAEVSGSSLDFYRTRLFHCLWRHCSWDLYRLSLFHCRWRHRWPVLPGSSPGMFCSGSRGGWRRRVCWGEARGWGWGLPRCSESLAGTRTAGVLFQSELVCYGWIWRRDNAWLKGNIPLDSLKFQSLLLLTFFFSVVNDVIYWIFCDI